MIADLDFRTISAEATMTPITYKFSTAESREALLTELLARVNQRIAEVTPQELRNLTTLRRSLQDTLDRSGNAAAGWLTKRLAAAHEDAAGLNVPLDGLDVRVRVAIGNEHWHLPDVEVCKDAQDDE